MSQKGTSEYSASCCHINMFPEIQESGPKNEVYVINLASDTSISNIYFFQRDVMEQWTTEISVTQALQKSIWLLQRQYLIDNFAEINGFLFNHKDLLDILLIIPIQVQHFFGEVSLELQVIKDPEEDYEGLFIIIKSNFTPEKSIDLLDQMEDYWWLDVDINIKKLIGIDVEIM